MFERFTEKAIKVIMLAQREAQMTHHNFVDTEQILAGLLAEGTDIAFMALDSLGVDLHETRRQVEAIIGPGADTVSIEIPFRPAAKRLLELSWDEARILGHNYIGTEHLLLGLCRLNDGVGAQILLNQGLDLDVVRKRVLERLADLGALPSLATVENKCIVPRMSQRDIAEPTDLEPILAKLSEDARAAYEAAIAEAQRLKCSILGTEQLLVGLISCSSSRASVVMQQMGIDEDAVRAEFERMGEYGTAASDETVPQLSPRVKLALACAFEEAKECGHSEIGTTHLLVGMLDQDGGVAFHVLKNLGVDVFVLRAKSIAVMKNDRRIKPRLSQSKS